MWHKLVGTCRVLLVYFILLFRLKQMSWLDRQYNLKPVLVKLKNNSIDETANL